MKRLHWMVLFAGLALAIIQVSMASPPALAQVDSQFVPGQIIIRFHSNVSAEQILDFYAEYGLSERDDLTIAGAVEPADLKLASAPVDVNDDLIELLSSDPRVLYAEPNYLLSISQEEPDDPLYDQLWGLNNTGQSGGTNDADIDAPEAWEVSTGSKSVLIVVTDTGVDYTHEDLIDNMWANPKECPKGAGKCEPDGKDNDNNGYIDDFYGINTITDSGDPMDDFGHGTHVAGIIGATGDNATGVVGVNHTVRIVGCKFLSATGGGTVAAAVKCFQYIDDLKNKQGYNVVATNNSWGGGAFSQALFDAMNTEKPPLHICAAGNSNSSSRQYPAGYDLAHIISVAATDHNDEYASFSSYGADWVDLAAPGADILSTVPKTRCQLCNASGYRTVSGTSMATPHVAGAAALLKAKYSSLDNEQIKQRIISGIDPLQDDSKQTMTNGRLNLFNSLEEDLTPPSAVNDLALTGVLMTRVNLSWTATGDDGNSGLATAYDLRYSTKPLSDENWQQGIPAQEVPIPQEPGALEKFTVTDLSPNTTYYFGLRVLDNVGNGSAISNLVIGKTSAGAIVFEDDMEKGVNGWTVADEGALWHQSSLRFQSPSTAWYYGQDESRNYDTGEANRGSLTSPAIEISGADDVLLTFHEWSQLQSSTRFDRTIVQVSTDGVIWKDAFESHGTADAWIKRSVSLTPYVEGAASIHVRFFFDTVSGSFNTFEGWFVDDVQVITANLSQPGAGVPTANLSITEKNIGFNPPDPIAVDVVTVHATIINNGAADANDVVVQFMEVNDEGFTPIGTARSIPSIAPGSSGVARVVYTTWKKEGEHEIRVIVDPNNFIPESNESDNSATATLTVRPRPLPNLVVEKANIGFEPPNPSEGDQVTINATILNNGATAANDVMIQFMDSTGSGSTPIGQPQNLDIIPAGGSATAQITYDTSGVTGDRDITVIADPNNAIAEEDEDDNDGEAELEMQAADAPDLTVRASNIGFNPAAPVMGDEVTINVTILNQGALDAEDILVQFVDVTDNDSVPIGQQQTIAQIAAGSSGTAQVMYDTTNRAGDRKIEVIVDPHNFIAEAKESDNSAKETLRVDPPPAPNLAVSAANLNFYPVDATEGQDVTVHVTVLNNGTADASDVAVQFMDVTDGGSTPIGTRQTIETIAGGGSGAAQVRFASEGKVGNRRIQVMADPNNFIAELDETDNAATQGLEIAPLPMPNLLMLANNVELMPPTPTDAERVSITAVVLNNGESTARDILVQFIDITSGVPVPIGREQTIDEIAVGGSATAQADYTLDGTMRDRKIQVLIDSNNLIAESNENDNETTKILPVRAAPAPNLAVLTEGIGFNPRRAIEGDIVTINALVLNNGAQDAANVEVQFMDVSSGRALPIGDKQIIESIAVGGSGAVQVQYEETSTPGEHKIRVVVDPNNFIPESSETDNRATATLLIAASPRPNLMIQSSNIGFDPPNPIEGQPVSVTVTILNVGRVDAEDVLVQLVDISEGEMIPVDAKQTLARIAAGGSAIARFTYTTDDRVGDRKLQVLLDPHTILPETNEQDNSASQVLTVHAGLAPNLAIEAENIGFDNSNPTTGDLVTIHAAVLNNGSAPAADVFVQFVDVTDDGATPIGASQTITNLAPGSSSAVAIEYDTTGAHGDRKIQVLVDQNNLIPETNEADNDATATLSVAQPPAANLVMSSGNIGFDPSQANQGDQVTINATVLNDGSADAGEVLVQFVDVTGSGSAPIGQPQILETIPAGGSASVQIIYDTSGKSADRKIEVVVDPNNFIPELKESDNDAAKTLTMVPLPTANLIMRKENVTFSPALPHVGDEVVIRAVVVNGGTAVADNVIVRFMDITDDDATMSIGQPQTIDTITVGGSGTAQVRYAIDGEAGKRKIRVIVDPNNFVVESKESDNTVSSVILNVAETPAPNLTMLSSNIGLNPLTPIEGDIVTIHAVVLNNGAIDVGDVVVRFTDASDGNRPIGQPQTITTIGAGASGTAQVAYETDGVSGERQIEVEVDPSNFIAESDESDNSARVTVPVQLPPAPNLVVLAGAIQIDPPQPEVTERVSVTVNVLNDGTEEALDVVVEILELTDTGRRPVGTERLIESIPAGETRSVEVLYDNTSNEGERLLQVLVDPGNLISESNENDNVSEKRFTVSPPAIPNLVIRSSDLLFDPATPTAGDLVTISVTFENRGTDIAENVVVIVEDISDGNEVIGEAQSFEALEPGESETFTLEYDTLGKEGERRIRVTLDPDNSVIETDEADNSITKSLRVAAEDEEPPAQANLVLTTKDIAFDPVAPSPGDMVTVTITVTNAGAAGAEDVIVRLEDTTDEEATLIGERMITGTLAAEASGQVRFAFDTTGLEGDRTLQATADPENAIPESNEEDNQASATLKFGSDEGGGDDGGDEGGGEGDGDEESAPQANLTVDETGIRLDPPVPGDGGQLTVAAMVRNSGDQDATSVLVHFSAITLEGSQRIGNGQMIASLAAGESAIAEITYAYSPADGDRSIQIEVDPNNWVAETDESDNRITFDLLATEADGLQATVIK